MPDKFDSKRRALLKGLGITAMTLGASFTMPENWMKPIARVGVLPAHAQTSPCQDIITSTPATLTVYGLIEQPAEDEDGINIYFNGCDNLSMASGDEPDTSNPNFILFLDVDSGDGQTFDIETGPLPSSPWSIVSTSWTPDGPNGAVGDEPQGTGFTIRLQKESGLNAGATFDVVFDVTVSPVTNGFSMTVSNLQASRVIP